MPNSLLPLLLLCSLSTPTLSQTIPVWVTPDALGEAGSQTILYYATLAATFTHPPSLNLTHCGTNGTYNLTIGSPSPIYIGKNPPWDTNPFFFWFYRLNFKSAAFVCHEGGKKCGSLESWPWYYVQSEMVDLSEVVVTREKGEGGGFYRVEGDEKAFVSNGTDLNPALFFTGDGVRNVSGTGQRDERGCLVSETISWNRSVPFTFSVNFTNSTVSALVDVESDEGHLVIRYTNGQRVLNETGKVYNDRPMSVSLLPPEEHEFPQFVLEDREMEFYQQGSGTWDARPGEAKKESGESRLRPGIWTGIMVGLFVLLW